MEKFDNVLEIARVICGFIFSHSEVVPPEITSFTFGISSSIVSVRFKGNGIYNDGFKEDSAALYRALQGMTAEKLTITSFMDGLALRFEYTKKGLSEKSREDNPPEGALFSVETTDGKNEFLNDTQLFTDALKPLFEDTFPDHPDIEVFLNGNRMKLT